MSEIKDRVLVTGGSGFIGLHIVDECLKAGYQVNATTRSLTSESAEPLHFLAKQYPNQLQLFVADLLEPGAYKQASQGVIAVIHVATPNFFGKTLDDPDQQIKPAVEGTRNVLQTCLESTSIKTIILTSSIITITDRSKPKDYIFTELDFSPHDNEEFMPYQRAKILAEREVWEFHQQHPQFRIVTIHPSFVLGPDLEPEGFKLKYNKPNPAKNCLEGIINGTVKYYEEFLPLVDIKDTALAHLRALQCPDAQGRFIIFGSFMSVAELTYKVEEILPQLKFGHPSPPIPEYIKYNFDNQKSQDILGLSYRSILDSLTDTLLQLQQFL